jgi:hypothetical protein
MASLTIATGELIFSTRGGALFGYRILFVFALISVLKWGLVVAAARHMLLTGVHPYERMCDLPGPRGWLPMMLLLLSAVTMPIWMSFHATVLGNLVSWITGTRNVLGGGIDYAWGVGLLVSVLVLAALGGYTVLEKIQMAIVAAMVFCAGATLLLYNPDWLELILGVVPQPLVYPDWVAERYPQIAERSVWVETTTYVGVIGGAGFDYLAYTSWLREKAWGILPGRASPDELAAMAADREHPVRRWVTAPLVDSAISFAIVVAFSAVFVASGALVLGPRQLVPTEDDLLNLQAKFVTEVHDWLLPLYVVGAFLTMFGTLYGTVEIACRIADEIVRSLVPHWSAAQFRRLKLGTIAWCATIALGILASLALRHASYHPAVAAADGGRGNAQAAAPDDAVGRPAPPAGKRIMLTVLTPVNLFTGVLSCGLICCLSLWMDRRYLPKGLRMPAWLAGLNLAAAPIFLGLGIKGYWDSAAPQLAVAVLAGAGVVALLAAAILRPRPKDQAGASGDQ